MKNIDKAKMITGIVTGLIVLFGIIEAAIIKKDDNLMLIPVFSCAIGWFYSNFKWVSGFLSKNPDKSWRQLPRFLKDDPTLNAYCFNFYKWFALIVLFAIIMIKLFLDGVNWQGGINQ
jgi:hypothetical protein